MSLIKINWNPSDKELQSFGAVAIAATLLISVVLYAAKGLAIGWCGLIVGLGFFIFLSSRLSVKFTRRIYVFMVLVTFPIGTTISFILMATFYYLLLTPVGLFFRLIGRDALQRKIETSAKTYWQPRRHHDKIERYFNQF